MKAENDLVESMGRALKQDFQRIDDSGLVRELGKLLREHHTAHVIGALLSLTVRIMRTVVDKSLRRDIESHYMHAYQMWVGMEGDLTPKELMSAENRDERTYCSRIIWEYVPRGWVKDDR